MKIAIVDDEVLWRKKSVAFIQSYLGDMVEDIADFASGESFLEDGKSYDLVCLDVEMGGMDGFQTAMEYKSVKKDTIIIILTIHTELSRRGYMVNAFRYVDKGSMEEELKEALSAVQKLLKQNTVVEMNVVKMGPKHFSYKDIAYIEVSDRKIYLHTAREKFQISESIGQAEELLKEQNFYRSHKSYLVNLYHISFIKENGDIIMKNGEKAMVGLRKLAELKRKFIDYHFEYGSM